MKPPKCRVCGKEHWSTGPHVWTDEKSIEILSKMAKTAKETLTEVKQKTFDRASYQREYMREYMRKRRQSAKEK